MRKSLHYVEAELKQRYREYFESYMSGQLLANANHFLSLQTVSHKIAVLLAQHAEKVVSLIEKNPKIVNELKPPYFGHFYQTGETPTAQKIYEDFLRIMRHPAAHPEAAMQMHCIFEYRIYPDIEMDQQKLAEKEKALMVLKPNSFFSKNSRSRVDKNTAPKETRQSGFTLNPVFSKMLKREEAPHVRAVDRYAPDEASGFSQEARRAKMPVICGPSVHTASLLSGAVSYGGVSRAGLLGYTCVFFSFLAVSGNHTFHEVFMVAALLGLPYQQGNYASVVPASLCGQGFFQALQERFPEFISVDSPAETVAL